MEVLNANLSDNLLLKKNEAGYYWILCYKENGERNLHAFSPSRWKEMIRLSKQGLDWFSQMGYNSAEILHDPTKQIEEPAISQKLLELIEKI
jgi:hypothetical protein